METRVINEGERERETHTHTLTHTNTHTLTHEAQSGPCTNTWLINLTSHTLHIHSWYKRDQKSRWASEDERGSRHQSRRKNGPVGSTCMWPDVEEGVCRQLFGVGGGYGRRGHSSLSPKNSLCIIYRKAMAARPCKAMQETHSATLPTLPHTHAQMHTPTHPRTSLTFPAMVFSLFHGIHDRVTGQGVSDKRERHFLFILIMIE